MRLLIASLLTLAIGAGGWTWALDLERRDGEPMQMLTLNAESAVQVSFATMNRPRPEPPKKKVVLPTEKALPIEAPQTPVPIALIARIDTSEPVPEQQERRTFKSLEEPEPWVKAMEPDPSPAEPKPELQSELVVKPSPPSTAYLAVPNAGEKTILRAGNNPIPVYPRNLLERGREGIVLVRVTIADDGSMKDVVIVTPEAHRDFQRAVHKAIRHWRAEKIGDTMRQRTIRVRFSIKNGRPHVSSGEIG